MASVEASTRDALSSPLSGQVQVQTPLTEVHASPVSQEEWLSASTLCMKGSAAQTTCQDILHCGPALTASGVPQPLWVLDLTLKHGGN